MNSGTIIFAFLVVLLMQLTRIVSDESIKEFFPNERLDLIQFREALSAIVNLHSKWTGPPCSYNQSRWIGIKCSNSHVVGLVLEGVELTGSLPPIALQNIIYLTKLNLRNNALHGPLPNLQGLVHLQVVLLSKNRFSGSIPKEFTELPDLSKLELQDNFLNGTTPPFNQRNLKEFNVSYNFLQGPIPETSTMQKFPSSSYDHNLELCGKPLDNPCPASSPPPLSSSPPKLLEKSKDKAMELWTIVVIAMAAVIVASAVILFFMCYYKRRHGKETGDSENSGGFSVDGTERKAKASGTNGYQERIVALEFFDRERPVFDLDDLLTCSAEVMRKGVLGTTYKSILELGPVLVVKRLKEMNGLTKKEFVQQMQLLGKMRHENLVEIISFYHSKDEKLLISEYVPGGSLFELLHGNRGEGRIPLNWVTRLSILKGIARGLAYLHQCLPSHKVPHGNLKSSNVIIHHSNPKHTDFGFLPLLLPNAIGKLTVGKTPEFSQGKKLTHKADVYCFGLISLELITGKMPSDNSEDLAHWVSSVVNVDWSTDIFDLEILDAKEGHSEMLKVTEIALECTALEPKRRPKMSEVVGRIEEIMEADEEERIP